MNTQDWAKELNEFVGAARIFKPLTGTMATRFTTSTTTASNFQGNMDRGIDGEVLVHRPAEKPEDPAEAAAKLGMYGPLTRSTVPFTPCRLLCKRFNVPFVGIAAETGSAPVPTPTPTPGYGGDVGVAAPLVGRPELGVDADKNEALEGEKAAEEVFRNIFGDSDDEED